MEAVLRISTHEAADGTWLTLEGQLVGPWVAELAQACAPLLSQGLRLTLDLAGVSFVGREGLELLWKLRDSQVALRNSSRFVDEQLKARASDGR